VIAVVRELGLPEDVVNVEDGAIARRHPISAVDAIFTTRHFHSMSVTDRAMSRHTVHRRRPGLSPWLWKR
jgi:acetyl-CoA acetyltransferase